MSEVDVYSLLEGVRTFGDSDGKSKSALIAWAKKTPDINTWQKNNHGLLQTIALLQQSIEIDADGQVDILPRPNVLLLGEIRKAMIDLGAKR